MSCPGSDLLSHGLRWIALAALIVAGGRTAVSFEPPAGQVAQYEANVPKTILELQQFRRTTTRDWMDASGRHSIATLIEINPDANAWFLLKLSREQPATLAVYHLENPDPTGTRVSLAQDDVPGLWIDSGGRGAPCALWPAIESGALVEARRSGLPYAPLCGRKLYLRNPVAGTYTHLEQVTNFLRDHVWGGDRIVNFVREEFFRDAFVERGAEVSAPPPAATTVVSLDAPRPALLDAADAGAAIVPEHLDIDLAGSVRTLLIGRWYAVKDASGIHVSAIRPDAIAAAAGSGPGGRVNSLDSVEAGALDYLVAFDLAEFDLGFELGTDHPRVDWSGREPDAMHDATLPGPDGIGNSAPLVRTGMVDPALLGRTAATFAGGFKREHGAFRYGDLSQRNHGSHYGFIEQGAVFSKLQPGLAPVYVLDDGTIGLKSWTRDDDALLPRIRHARQNGVPLIEYDARADRGIPGSLVAQWGAGNWSGSADEKLRTLRAGLCLQTTATRRFLIYGYFSTATPSAMVRVFQAYGCRYAMLLDMNALEHTYMALYTRSGGRLLVQHLVEGMAEVDRKGGGQLAPRFLSFPDDRDFFYLMRRSAAGAVPP